MLLLVMAAALCQQACVCRQPVTAPAAATAGTLVQSGTMDALLAGNYDGSTRLSEFATQGDFGVGTFDRLDGELIMLDGIIYQVLSSGEVRLADVSGTTPFAGAWYFKGQETLPLIRGVDLPGLLAAIDRAHPSLNVPLAIRLEGHFARVRVRAVPAQQRPYPPLAEVAKAQPEFEAENVSGTLMGFRLPPYTKGINIPGYHLHFLSDDHRFGGHVLAVELEEGTARVDVISRILVLLPVGQEGFQQADQGVDRSEELRRVENAR